MRMRSIKQTAEYFRSIDSETQITEATIRKMINEGTIPVVKTGVKYLINVDTLLNLCGIENENNSCNKVALEAEM